MEDPGLVARGSPELAPAELGLQVQADKAFQKSLLPGLDGAGSEAMRHLPDNLKPPVLNAYLLQRVLRTIDHYGGNARSKREARRRLFAALDGRRSSALTARELAHEINGAPPAERELLRNVDRILRVSHSLPLQQRQLTQRQLRTLCAIHLRYQRRTVRREPSLVDYEVYCRSLGADLAELLVPLFCNGAPELGRQHRELMRKAEGSAAALQMTRVLTELWLDCAVGSPSRLPTECFVVHPRLCDASQLRQGLQRLAALACEELRAGLALVEHVPASQPQVRRFCIAAVAAALVSLRAVARPHFAQHHRLQAPRLELAWAKLLCEIAVRHPWLLKWSFALARVRPPRWRPHSHATESLAAAQAPRH